MDLPCDLTPARWEVSRKQHPFSHWGVQVRVTCPATEGETEAWGLCLAHAQEAGKLGCLMLGAL